MRVLYPAQSQWGERIVDIVPGETELELQLTLSSPN